MSNKRGIFITFEGGDGVGKSTQVAFFASLLERLGYDVLLLREPGGTRIGEHIREVLLDINNHEITNESELMLYLAARSQIVNEVIKPALEAVKVVLCDRYFDSTVAYQGYGRGMDIDFIKRANEFVCDGVVPDKTILFYISEEEQKSRLGRREATDRIEDAGPDFSMRVARGFMEIAEGDPARIEPVSTSGIHSEAAMHVLNATADLLDLNLECDVIVDSLKELDLNHNKNATDDGEKSS